MDAKAALARLPIPVSRISVRGEHRSIAVGGYRISYCQIRAIPVRTSMDTPRAGAFAVDKLVGDQEPSHIEAKDEPVYLLRPRVHGGDKGNRSSGVRGFRCRVDEPAIVPGPAIRLSKDKQDVDPGTGARHELAQRLCFDDATRPGFTCIRPHSHATAQHDHACQRAKRGTNPEERETRDAALERADVAGDFRRGRRPTRGHSPPRSNYRHATRAHSSYPHTAQGDR